MGWSTHVALATNKILKYLEVYVNYLTLVCELSPGDQGFTYSSEGKTVYKKQKIISGGKAGLIINRNKALWCSLECCCNSLLVEPLVLSKVI